MKKIFTLVAVGFLFLSSPVFAENATSTPSQADTIEQLREQIKELQSQIGQLTAELAAIKKEVATVKEELRITKTLKFGMADEEVKKLQEFLSKMPDVYPEGLVTGYFGPLTEKAVKNWQEKNGIENIGIVGPKTRAKLSEVSGGSEPVSGSASTPPDASTSGIQTTTTPGLENRAENRPTTTPSGTSPATPAISAQPTGQTGATTVSATPAIPATPASSSTGSTTPPITQYTITVTQSANGTISPSTISIASGGGQTFTIASASGYQIGNLIVDGANVAAAETYTFTNITASHTLSAVFNHIATAAIDKSPRALISLPDAQFQPRTSGNNIIYWDHSSGTMVLMLGSLAGGPTILLSSAATIGEGDIDGDYAVFTDIGPSGNWNIFLYKISTGEKIRINDAYSYEPAIQGDRVVWVENGVNKNRLVAYRISTGSTTVIADISSLASPDVYGDKIVWSDKLRINDPNSDIYLYDFQTATTTQITTAPCQQEYPEIWENIIVWADKRDSNCSTFYNGNVDVYYRNLSTGAEIQVTTSGYPVIMESKIAYSNNGDIYLYDLTAGTKTQVTSDGATQSQAHLSPSWLTWVDYRGSSPDIWGMPMQ